MVKEKLRKIFVLFSLLSFLTHYAGFVAGKSSTGPAPVDVGVILDLNSSTGRQAKTSINLALDDFYAVQENYTTKLVLHVRDSQSDVIEAASAAVDLLKNVKVHAIIGPQTSSEAEFVAELGTKAHVPVLSFSATSPTLSFARTPYFVRTTTNDSSQVHAIAALVKRFGWREVVPVYQDTDCGTGIIPYLTDALQSETIKVPYRSVIPPSPSDDQLSTELNKLMTMQTRVFIVHMMPGTALKLFEKAEEIGMMSSGYVWIVTDDIADSLDILEGDSLIHMQGVLGVRPYVPRNKTLTNFKKRWKARFRRDNPGILEGDGPTVLQLWAYDTVQALAMAAETARISGSPQFKDPADSTATNSTDLAKIAVSQTGSTLLAAILATRFHGVSGEFKLVDGQVSSLAFQIVNIIGRSYKDIGSWNLSMGISEKLSPVMWPGDSTSVPKGWQIPTTGKVLKVGIPVKNGFNEFVNISWDPSTNRTTASGYCIDVFEAVIQSLPYAVPFVYIPYGDPSTQTPTVSYDDMVKQVYLKKFDAVVGDVTIVADRSNYVDFTLPFTESGVSMIVPLKDDKNKNMWIFLKPLTTDLWLGSLAFFFFTGFVIWIIEHRINPEFRGDPSYQLGTVLYFAFSTLVFAHRERLEHNLSRLIVIIWVFVVLILTQSYTASLTSMLTVQQLLPTVADVNLLLKSPDYIGYQDGSFVGDLLESKNFDKQRLKNYSTPDQYAEALSNGSAKGGITALFDEIPYIKVFLSRYCADDTRRYSMVGPTYKTGGFGFAFPIGSPLVPDVSRAILNVTEGDKMVAIERKWFGEQAGCPSKSNTINSSTSLSLGSFGGLFLISGVVSVLALIIFFAYYVHDNWEELRAASTETSIWPNIVALARHFNGKDWTAPTFKKDDDVNVGDENTGVTYFDASQTPTSTSDLSDLFTFSGRPSTELSNTDVPVAASIELSQTTAAAAHFDSAIEIEEISHAN